MHDRLKDLRQGTDLTQEQFAHELGYHTTTYVCWEQQFHNIKLIDAMNIAKYYNVSLDYLAGLIDEPRKLHKD